MSRITAGLVAGGTFLCVVATPLLLASAYAKVMEYVNALLAVASENPGPGRTSTDEALAWSGWLCLGIGGLLLAVGLYRLIACRRVREGSHHVLAQGQGERSELTHVHAE